MKTKTISTGYTPSYEIGTDKPESDDDKKKKEPPVYYPSITLQGDAAKKLMNSLETGQEMKATVTMKCVEKADRGTRSGDHPYPEDGCRLEFEVTNITPDVNLKMEDDEDEDDFKSAMSKYREEKKQK